MLWLLMVTSSPVASVVAFISLSGNSVNRKIDVMQLSMILGLLRRFWPVLVCGVALASVVWMKASRDAARADLKIVREELTEKKAELAFLKVDAAAKENAARDRVIETAAVAASEKVLIDAIQTVPDSAPDPVRVALGCQRLRSQGTPDANLPGVCRLDGRSKAGSQP
ncbi:MAG: hypothetical protein ACRCYS_11535 [Beijerinckiaceae bacterium]